MKKLLIIFVFLSIGLSAFSQNTNKNIYSGGMLVLQPGYLIAENNHQKINELNLGIGGILRFYFSEYFTAGIYGGTLKTTYHSTNSKNSYINLGYGGPFVGFSHKSGKFRYSASAFIGMGSIKNLHIESQTNNLLSDAYLYKSSTMVLFPILSLDYALSEKISITLQAVYLAATMSNNKPLYNPTVQLGVLFNR